MPKRVTQIMGSSFYPGAGNIIMRLRNGQILVAKREPTNKYDPNAIAVLWGDKQLGHVSRQLAAHLAPLMDLGVELRVAKYGTSQACIVLNWDGEPLPEGK